MRACGVFPLVCLAAVYVCGWRISVLVNAFVVNDFTVTYVASNSIPSFRCGIAWRLPGARMKARTAVGAADERLDLCGGDF